MVVIGLHHLEEGKILKYYIYQERNHRCQVRISFVPGEHICMVNNNTLPVTSFVRSLVIFLYSR